MANRPKTVWFSWRGLAMGLAPLLPFVGAVTIASKAASPHPASVPKAAALPRLHYNTDIRPILAENCFSCHGPDSAARQVGLRLDKFADIIAKHEDHATVVPGNPGASELIRRISAKDGDPLRMPPSTGHKRLTDAQRQILARWITEGATYEPHWAYIAPKKAILPPVKNSAWVRNPIDRFVLARLEAAGLTPAPEADRRTLARRLCLDLTGLPPEPAEVERFVADKRPDAYERLVDRYLASPRWGEHRGRYWLDAARYADTHGIHFDNYRELWSYRDWVIKAFNANMTFDRFTVEQLAGDLLLQPTLDEQIATGFNRCNITTNEGGSIPEEVAVMYTRDRTETTAQVWLGTTAGCAVCHDHKFDPLTQKEFYSLSAFFNNTTQQPLDGNIKDTPPILTVPLDKDKPRWDALQAELVSARQAVETRKTAARGDFSRWQVAASQPGTAAAVSALASIPNEGLRLRLPLDEGQGKTVAATMDSQAVTLTAEATPGWEAGQTAAKAFVRATNGAITIPKAGDFENNEAFTCAAWVKLPKAGMSGSVVARMDDQHGYRGWDMWLEGGRPGTHIIHEYPQNAVKVVTRDALKPGEWHHICFTYDGGKSKNSIRYYVDGRLKPTDAQNDSLKDTIRTEVPFKIGQRDTSSAIDGTAIQDVRLYGRTLTGDDVLRLARGTRAAYLSSRLASALAASENEELFGWWLVGADAAHRVLSARVTALEAEKTAIAERGTVAYVAQEKPEAPKAFVLNRGEYDQRRDLVGAGTPAMLPPMPKDFPHNRLGFARWLLLPNNPLTARVTVNRFWQEIWGAGIIRTTGDFGVTGELPSHPELLDYLAVDFRESGWDVKRFFKQVVMSAAYRQSAQVTPEKKQKDPANRLLSRGPRFRMDGEMVRDYALSAAGMLGSTIGGPSVKPYQPEGVWEAVAIVGSNTRFYKQDSGDALYRRSMYTFWKRSAPPASMEVFNAPSREVCTVRRERTDTPLQALVTLNDPQFIEAARCLAQHALRNGGTTTKARLDYIARRLLARPLRPEEEKIAAHSLADLQAYYSGDLKNAGEVIHVGESHPDPTIPPATLAAWTMLSNQLLNLDEVLNQ